MPNKNNQQTPGSNSLPVLQQLKITEPCPLKWNQLDGGDSKRFCGSCEKHVHNISEMDEDQVQRLFQSGERVCVKMQRRADGSIITKERNETRRGWLSKFGKIAAGVMAIFLISGCDDGPAPLNKARNQTPPDDTLNGPLNQQKMGKAEVDPMTTLGEVQLPL